MALPSINLIKDYVIPAHEEKNYTSAYLTELLIRADPNNRWYLRVKLMPYDAESKQLGPIEGLSVMQVNNLLAESERSPVIGKAIYDVLTVLSYLVDEKRGITKLSDANKAWTDAHALPDSDEGKTAAIEAANILIAEARQIITDAREKLQIQESSSSSSIESSSSSST